MRYICLQTPRKGEANVLWEENLLAKKAQYLPAEICKEPNSLEKFGASISGIQ